MGMSTFWLIACVLFMFIEILTVGFLFFWLGIGAFCAFIMALLGLSIPIQVGTFSIISIVLIILMKPLLSKFVKVQNTPTNIDATLGKTCIVTKTVDPITNKCQVKLSSELWTATNANEKDVLNVGDAAKVVKIDGVKLVVEKLNK
ncbi:MAG: NfeD family protein [Clostridia bacterium]